MAYINCYENLRARVDWENFAAANPRLEVCKLGITVSNYPLYQSVVGLDRNEKVG